MDNYMQDRRRALRHYISAPLKWRAWGSVMLERSGQSLNISQVGIYLETNASLKRGQAAQVRLAMPEQVFGAPSREWLCTGHVVRVERNGADGQLRVGVKFGRESRSASNDRGFDRSRDEGRSREVPGRGMDGYLTKPIRRGCPSFS
jgi:PilZ domain